MALLLRWARRHQAPAAGHPQPARDRAGVPRRDAGAAAAGLPAGLAEAHSRDLRHAGNQFTAGAGANPRELMPRMGHDSPPAPALIYLHSSAGRQPALAEAAGKAARAELAKSKKRTAAKPSGTQKARKRKPR